MNKAKIVIAGGGMVAGYAAKQMVELGLKPGDLSILSADSSAPYERPPLSKGFLAGKDTEDSISISPGEFYTQQGIELRLDTAIAKVDSDRQRLSLESGEELGYENLIIATGARPRTLDLSGAKLKNVLYLRSLRDSKAIRDAMQVVKRAIVIGGGFIGMEVAAVLAQRGIEVTMVLNEDRIWKKFFTPEMSRFFESYYVQRGVRFLKVTQLTEIRGDAAVRGATTNHGETIECDLVVAGIGVVPVTDFLAGSGIEVGDGIIVNEYLETRRPGILAAGDVANYSDVLFDKRRRVEHWDNAVSQGQHCARRMMGDRAPFRHVPYFFSDVFDLSYELWGDTANADEVVYRGDLSSSSFSAWWLRENRVAAAFVMNRPEDEREAALPWIESKQRVSTGRLRDPARAVSDAKDA